MPQRNILPDCCEDWILEFGDFYTAGEEFSCLECGNNWQKIEKEKYLQTVNQKVFRKKYRQVGETQFAYLASEDGDNPSIERCCAKLIVKYGGTTRLLDFRCPVCHAGWHREVVSRGGISVVAFSREGLQEPFAVQKGTTRSFLVPISSYSPPLE